jgi:CRP-like cAMP-binding protein
MGPRATRADDGRDRQDHWHLRRLNWLSTLTRAQAATVRRASRRREYDPRESIFRPTREPRHVCLLEDGLVRIFRLSPAGEEFTLGYVRPGEIFGEVSVLTGQARASFAQAARRSRVLEIPKSVFVRAVRGNPPLYEVARRIGRRLIRCQSHAEDLVFYDARTRLARLLLRLADDFGRRTDRGLALGLQLTQHELATLIGSTRQTVSLALRGMVRTGAVTDGRRGLLIVDQRELREVAGFPTASGSREGAQ